MQICITYVWTILNPRTVATFFICSQLTTPHLLNILVSSSKCLSSWNSWPRIRIMVSLNAWSRYWTGSESWRKPTRIRNAAICRLTFSPDPIMQLVQWQQRLSGSGPRQTDGGKLGLVWKIERKVAKWPMTAFTHCSLSYLYYELVYWLPRGHR